MVVAVSIIFAAPTRGKDKDASDEVQVEKLTLVRDTGKDFQTVKRFKTTDTFGVLVKLSAAKAGTKVKAVWIAANAGGMEDKKIFEKEVTFTEEALESAKIKDRVDFTLSHDNPYPTGEYKVEIYLNGELADAIDFEIE
jgi:outer membrane usher protein FimD/PapC